MATESTIEIGNGGGTITFSVTSDPTPPSISISTTGGTWMTVSGSNVTVSQNTGTARTGNISLSATTPSNAAYNGTASVTSAYTVTQLAGGSTQPKYSLQIEWKQGNWFMHDSYIGPSVTMGSGGLVRVEFGSTYTWPAYQWNGGSRTGTFDVLANGVFKFESDNLNDFMSARLCRTFSPEFPYNSVLTFDIELKNYPGTELIYVGDMDGCMNLNLSGYVMGHEYETVVVNMWPEVTLY